MSDRLIEQDIQKAIRLVETLDKRLIDCIQNDSFSLKDMGLIYQRMEAAGLNPKDQNDWLFLLRAAKERRRSEKQCPLEFIIEEENVICFNRFLLFNRITALWTFAAVVTCDLNIFCKVTISTNHHRIFSSFFYHL